MTKGKIYHLVPVKVWEKALEEVRYRPASLKAEGFIHCSTQEQVLESAQRHFTGHDELTVLTLLEKPLKGLLKWEPSRGGELFPHVYGEFPWEAVETSRMLFKNKEGVWEWE